MIPRFYNNECIQNRSGAADAAPLLQKPNIPALGPFCAICTSQCGSHHNINILEDPIHVTTISQHLCWNTLYIVFCVFDFYARPRV